jgi:hypothetical protein
VHRGIEIEQTAKAQKREGQNAREQRLDDPVDSLFLHKNVPFMPRADF